MRVAVIGVGNTAVADDGIGVLAVRELRKVVTDARVSFHECERGGLDLLDLLHGVDRAIIVDASCTGSRPPGSLLTVELALNSSPRAPFSIHTMNLHEVLALGAALGMALPSAVTIVGMEAKDIETFGAPCTPIIAGAFPRLVDLLVQMLQSLLARAQVASWTQETVPP